MNPATLLAPPADAEGAQPRTTGAHELRGPFGWTFQVPEFTMPSPRSAAAAMLCVLAFGVVISSGNAGFAAGTVNLFVNLLTGHSTASSPTQAGNTPAGSHAGGGGGGGGGSSSSGGTTSGGGGGTTTPGASTTTPTPVAGYPPVKHLFVITLADQDYSQTFSSSTGDTYLAHVVARKGMLIPSFFAVAQSELPNEIAMLSGQGPTKQTEQGCPVYSAMKLKKLPKGKKAPDGQVLGNGCVYPKSTPTLLSELQAAGYTWKAYVQGLGKQWSSKASVARRRDLERARELQVMHFPLQGRIAARAGAGTARGTEAKAKSAGQSVAATCRHPQLGAKDGFQGAGGSDDYVTWRNPLMYFAAVTESKNCNDTDVGLNRLQGDLKQAKSTPNLTLIYPDPCDDGSDTPCKRGAKNTGIPGADSFLRQVLPPILKSPAYRQAGMVIITFDQAPQAGPHADHSSCCGNPTYPNLASHAVLLSNAGVSHATSTPTGTSSTPTGTTPTGTGSTPTTTTTGCTTTTATGTTTTGTTGTGTGTTATGTTPTGTGPSTSPTDTSTTTTGCTTATTTTPPPSPPACITFGTCKATGGGGDVGLVIISKFVKPASIDPLEVYNDYSLLESIEAMFGLTTPLGYTASSSVKPFSSGSNGVYNNYGG